MFKIEPYVTPLILSYVNKYIKNIKPEDSQVSLWGGDAVFHNLDLRLDVLEAELHSPFTFSSGHIHELRIHVPWTKLASEPIVLTINTIECTLKLKNAEDRVSDKSSQSQKTRSKRQEVAAPPSYIQSLMSKIVNNVSIVCNNVILKYLEEDIVLSLNARTLTYTSVDSNWQTAFTELLPSELMLRKLMSVTDLTICLDQCNAQGKIPIYQEPLLYRCSLSVRICSSYPNMKASQAYKVHMDLLFPKLDFSLSDQQIPMFLRICKLALALHMGEFKTTHSHPAESKGDAHDVDVDESTEDVEPDQPETENQSWAGWAWGYVPAILPVYWEDEMNESPADVPQDRDRVVRFGIFIERVTWTFKWTQMIRDQSVSGPARMRFQPFLTVRMQGCFLQVILGGIQWVNVQGGISHVTLEPTSHCLCGLPEDVTLYFLQGCERDTFVRQSLYDPADQRAQENLQNPPEAAEPPVDSPPDDEKKAFVEDHVFHWDQHVDSVTESTLLERTPACGFDYLYHLEVPEDNVSELLSQIGSELEYSNLAERALLRLAVGPLQLKVSYGLCHRLSAVVHSIRQYNYPEYTSSSSSAQRPPPSHGLSQTAVDELVSMANNLPTRIYQVAAMRPLILLSLYPHHPAFDLQRLLERRVPRIVEKKDHPATSTKVIPVLKLACTCMDIQLTQPMYPMRLCLSAKSTPASGILSQSCYARIQWKVHELCADLVTEEAGIGLLTPCNASVTWHSLLLADLWADDPDRIVSSWMVEAEEFRLVASRPQLDYLTGLISTLSNPVVPKKPCELEAVEVFNLQVHPALEWQVEGLKTQYVSTISTVVVSGCIRNLKQSIQLGQISIPIVRLNHEDRRERKEEGCGRLIDFYLQLPYSLFQSSAPSVPTSGAGCPLNAVPVFSMKMQSLEVTWHPQLMKWIDYSTRRRKEESATLAAVATPPASMPASTLPARSNRTPDQSNARDSGLSSSLDGHTWRASSSLVMSGNQKTEASLSGDPSASAGSGAGSMDLIKSLLMQLQYTILDLDVEECTLKLPVFHEDPSQQIHHVGSSRSKGAMELTIQLPRIEVTCAADVRIRRKTEEVATRGVLHCERLASHSSFPWTVALVNFSVASQDHRFSRLILQPLSLKCAVALNPTCAPPKSASQSGKAPLLDLCIHVDMSSIEVLLDVDQLSILCHTANNSIGWIANHSVASTAASGAASTAASAKEQPSNPLDAFEMGLWLQWAMPRVVITLESNPEGNGDGIIPGAARIRTVLDAEDVATSVDFQKSYTKIKSRLTSVSAKLFRFKKTEDGADADGWIVDALTSGIVLSCNDDVTRDLQHSGIGADASGAAKQTSSPSRLGLSPTQSEGSGYEVLPSSKNGGGVVSMTWTRARRQHVYSRWNTRNDPPHTPSNQGEKLKAEEGDKSAPDVFLNEIDLAIESIDLIVTPTLLHHIVELSRPLHILDLQALTPEPELEPEVYQTLNSNHSLPLVFASTKNLRLFLVSDEKADDKEQEEEGEDEQFILLNVDSIELSPRVLNHIGRSWIFKPELYAEAEAAGSLNVPGQDVEDRQYQIDFKRLSISTGCWTDIANASWVSRTLNPTSSLHTMAENPALEWNMVRNAETHPLDARVPVTPILSSANIRTVYAPFMVSAEQQCVVAAAALEVNAITDVDLLFDVGQLDHFRRWIQLLTDAAQDLKGDPLPSEAPSQATVPVPFGTDVFVTCGRINTYMYEKMHPTEFRPYVAVSLVQPHALIRRSEAEELAELSIYNLKLLLPKCQDGSPVASTSVPDESLFRCSILETRAGTPSTRTGILPALLTVTSLAAGRKLDATLGRPLKLVLDGGKIRMLQFLMERMDQLWPHSPEVEESPEPTWGWWTECFNTIQLKTSQILLEAQILLPEATDLKALPVPTLFTVGFNEFRMKTSLHFDSVKQKMDKIESGIVMNAFCVKAEAEAGSSCQLCDPLNTECNVELLWPHWIHSSAQIRPIGHVNFRADNLRMHAGPRQVLMVQSLLKFIDHILIRHDRPQESKPSEAEELEIWKQPDADEQHYQDDLRTGAFDFQVRDTTGGGTGDRHPEEEHPRPLPYQVVFNVHPASMCWAYPQPRALTRVDVYPIPLIKADASGVGDHDSVQCSLEYWDHCSRQFKILRIFALSESRFTRVILPSVASAAGIRSEVGQPEEEEGSRTGAEAEVLCKQVVVSDMWRIVMNFTEENLPETRPKKIIAAPPSLVACTRVDSYFNARLVPRLQLGVHFNHISLSLHCQSSDAASVNRTRKLPADGEFRLDGALPGDFSFAALSLNQVSANARCGWRKVSADAAGQLAAHLLNFKYLVDESFVEPTLVEAKLVVDHRRASAFFSSHKPVYFNISQGVVHALSACLTSWSLWKRKDGTEEAVGATAEKEEEVEEEEEEEESNDDVVYTRYVIVNDTQEALRIGQAGTSESVLILPRQIHQYAWKCIGDNNELHVCMEGSRWRWCQPCGMDAVGDSVRLVSENKQQQLALIFTVKALNGHLQKEVSLRGQIQAASLLDQPLEIKLLPKADGPAHLTEMRGVVAASSVVPSFIFPLENLHGVKIRMPGYTWSGLIPFTSDCKSRGVLLVRVAQRDKEESLNLWCHLWTEKNGDQSSRLLILLSPLYVVRSYLPLPLQLHLRTPGLNSSQRSQLAGRAVTSVLKCPGSVDHGHQLSFQLSSDLPESTPSVPLSWTMASQYTNPANAQKLSTPFIDDLLDELFGRKSGESSWPYLSNDDEWNYGFSPEAPQPKTDVRVSFSSLHQRCHSLLVELKPWALLINQSGADLSLRQSGGRGGGGGDGADWLIANRSVIAPPHLTDTFQIGLVIDSGCFYSPPLILQDQDNYSFMSYRPRLEGTIPLEGYCCIRIAVDDCVCLLTVSSKTHNGMRILSIQPTFRLRNETQCHLKSGCLLASDRTKMYSAQKARWSQTPVKHCQPAGGSRSVRTATPLLFWRSEDDQNGADAPNAFLSFRLCSIWSCPIQLSLPNPRNPPSGPHRHCLSIPISAGCGIVEGVKPISSAVICTSLELDGLVYLTLIPDPNPHWILVNQTALTLAYGQASDSEPHQIEWHCDQFQWNGVLHPKSAAFYTPPWVNQRYPDASPPVNMPRLHIAQFVEGSALDWSGVVHPWHSYDQLVTLSTSSTTGAPDIMVRIIRTSTPNQTLILIEPVSRLEISAKDIRTRIQQLPPSGATPTADSGIGGEEALESALSAADEAVGVANRDGWILDAGSCVTPQPKSPGSPLCAHFHRSASELLALSCATTSLSSEGGAIGSRIDWNVTLHWSEVVLCFRDDAHPHQKEVLRVTADHLLIDYYNKKDESTCQMDVMCGHLQIDNQLFRADAMRSAEGEDESGGFDYPVVLLAQNQQHWPPTGDQVKLVECVRKNAMIRADVLLKRISARPYSLDVRLDPVFLFLEDHFAFAMFDYCSSFVVTSTVDALSLRTGKKMNRRNRTHPADGVAFPDHVSDILSSVAASMSLDRIVVHEMSLDLSLRSSTKLYIALDHSPLKLNVFERSCVMTTAYRLGQTLAMHYVSSALFKAGWVVGSLELLGSPTALARTVTLGLRDFVRLPYQGIWRGPRGFLAGIVNGSASLVSHVTAGTVTSVTQLANSVARNVDRLSCDSDFQQRSEEGRRKRPQGLVQGIGLGLSAFGLSLLGALGGLAHHPLQSIMEQGTLSPTDLAVGVTKGIIGVVAKPISGAADLVAQTGQGLLSATSWNTPFKAKHPESGSGSCSQLELFCSGTTRILWKLTDETPLSIGASTSSSRVCCCLEAMRARVNDALPLRDQLAPVMLVVSSANFCVLNAEDGEVQVVLDLIEVDCWAQQDDPTLVLVRPTPARPLPEPREVPDDFNPHYDFKRVAEFVRQTTPFVLPPEAAVSFVHSAALQPADSSVATMEFFINPTTREYFIQCFQIAKQQRQGIGFPLV